MIEKRLKRRRRATKARAKIREQGVARLCVGRTVKHLYAQVITEAPKGDQVLASASTLEKAVKARVSEAVSEEAVVRVPAAFNNVRSAAIIGGVIAERALALGITRVAFDRSGFKYHGRIKALAEAARKAGLNF